MNINCFIGLFFAILSLACYSAWGILNGYVANKVDAYSALFYSSLGYLFVGIVGLFFVSFQLKVIPINFYLSLILGLATGLGGLFLLLSIKYYQDSGFLVTITSCYPLITILFNYFVMHEQISLEKIIGCVLCVSGIIIMSL